MKNTFITILLFTAILLSGCSPEILKIKYNKNGEKMEKLNINALSQYKDSEDSNVKISVQTIDDFQAISIIYKSELNKTLIHRSSSIKGYRHCKIYFGSYEGKEALLCEASFFDYEGNPTFTQMYYAWPYIISNDNKMELLKQYETGGIRIGLWKEFDDKGNIIQVTDYDKDYIYGIDRINEYLKSKNINPQVTDVYVDRLNNLVQWEIGYSTIEDLGRYRHFVIIDGKTGEVLSEKKVKVRL